MDLGKRLRGSVNRLTINCQLWQYDDLECGLQKRIAICKLTRAGVDAYVPSVSVAEINAKAEEKTLMLKWTLPEELILCQAVYLSIFDIAGKGNIKHLEIGSAAWCQALRQHTVIWVMKDKNFTFFHLPPHRQRSKYHVRQHLK